MLPIICQHLQNNNSCAIALRLTGENLDCVTTESACSRCLEETIPKSANRVTASLAIAALRIKYGADLDTEKTAPLTIFLRRIAKQQEDIGSGIGSEVHYFLKYFGIHPSPSCSCLNTAKTMNDRGPEWCQKNKAALAADIARNSVDWFMDYIRKLSHWVLSFRLVSLTIIKVIEILLQYIINRYKKKHKNSPQKPDLDKPRYDIILTQTITPPSLPWN